MKVYVVETGCYEDKLVVGVYSSSERAMAAHPPAAVPVGHVPSARNASRPGGWQKDSDENSWDNGLDWQDAARITEYEVDAPRSKE